MDRFEMLAAVGDLKQFENQIISKEDLIKWRNEHYSLYNNTDFGEEEFENSLFVKCYIKFNEIYNFLENNTVAKVALDKYNLLPENNELSLLKWLIEYEWLYYVLILLPGDTIEAIGFETGVQHIVKEFNISISVQILKEALDFYELYEPIYKDKFFQYLTITKMEYLALDVFSDEYETNSSLKYHLEKRKII